MCVIFIILLYVMYCYTEQTAPHTPLYVFSTLRGNYMYLEIFENSIDFLTCINVWFLFIYLLFFFSFKSRLFIK